MKMAASRQHGMAKNVMANENHENGEISKPAINQQ
jgi:hypothetical protein